MKKSELILEINRLRKEKDAVILAHYYQEPDIQKQKLQYIRNPEVIF